MSISNKTVDEPFKWTKPENAVHKLDDLPKKPYTMDQVMQAMKLIHKLLHKQAEHYGGKHSKLYSAGIAEELTNKELLKGVLLLTMMEESESASIALQEYLIRKARDLT